MNIDKVSTLNFQSKAYPITPFIVNTKKGQLYFSEVTKNDLKDKNFLDTLTTFYCKNFGSLTNDPWWKQFLQKDKNSYKEDFNHLLQYWKYKINLKDPDMTLLIARDENNKIQGACLGYGFDELPEVSNTVYYIDSIAVNPEYRGYDIGKILLNKTIDSAKNKFSEAFLIGERLALGFYKKLGFKALDAKKQSNLINILEMEHPDYPDYVDFVAKTLNPKTASKGLAQFH